MHGSLPDGQTFMTKFALYLDWFVNINPYRLDSEHNIQLDYSLRLSDILTRLPYISLNIVAWIYALLQRKDYCKDGDKCSTSTTSLPVLLTGDCRTYSL